MKAKQDKKETAAARAKLQEAEDVLTRLRNALTNPRVPGLNGGESNKAGAKAAFCLEDCDLVGLSVRYGRGMMGNASANYQCSDLLRVADDKHGGRAGFIERLKKKKARTVPKEIREWEGKKTSAIAQLKALGVEVSGSAEDASAPSALKRKASTVKTSATKKKKKKQASTKAKLTEDTDEDAEVTEEEEDGEEEEPHFHEKDYDGGDDSYEIQEENGEFP